jgi:hypothetical protein
MYVAEMQRYLIDQLGLWQFCLTHISTYIEKSQWTELDKPQQQWASFSTDATIQPAFYGQFCSS